MNTIERIQHDLFVLPREKQEEVADFVHYLAQRYGTRWGRPGDILAHTGKLKHSRLFEEEPIEIQRKLRNEW